VKRHVVISIICSTLLSAFVGVSESQASAVIVTSSSSTPLAAGQSAQLPMSLDAPIICPAPSAGTCDVTIAFTVSDPSTLSLGTASINWTQATWSQSKSLTMTVNPNVTSRSSASVTITGKVTSLSAHYSGYTFTYTQAITLPSKPKHCHDDH